MLQDHLLTGRCFKAIMNGKGFLASSQWWATPPSPCYPQLVLKLLRKGAAAFYDSPSLTHEDKPRENGNPLLNTPSECLLPESSGKTYSLGTETPPPPPSKGHEDTWMSTFRVYAQLPTQPGSLSLGETIRNGARKQKVESQKLVSIFWIFYLLSNIRDITLRVSKMAQRNTVLADDP